MLDISAYTGMGSGRAAAVAISAVPPACDPVKAMALISGWAARAWPTVRPGPNSSEYTPPGRPQDRTASATADPASSAVPGWALWALTITGQPAASAEATSPPRGREGQREVAGPEHRHRAHAYVALAHIWPGQRRPVGLGLVDAHPLVRAEPDLPSEQPDLVGRAPVLALDPTQRQPTLQAGPGHDLVAASVEIGRHRLQERSPLDRRRVPEGVAERPWRQRRPRPRPPP